MGLKGHWRAMEGFERTQRLLSVKTQEAATCFIQDLVQKCESEIENEYRTRQSSKKENANGIFNLIN